MSSGISNRPVSINDLCLARALDVGYAALGHSLSNVGLCGLREDPSDQVEAERQDRSPIDREPPRARQSGEIGSGYRTGRQAVFHREHKLSDLLRGPGARVSPGQTMENPMTIDRSLLRRSAILGAAALAATLALSSGTALAGSCPSDKEMADATKPVDYAARASQTASSPRSISRRSLRW